MGIIQNEGISINAFEKKCGLAQGSVGSLTGGRTFRTDTLAKIAVAYPDLDIRWLLTGETSKTTPNFNTKAKDDKVIAKSLDCENRGGFDPKETISWLMSVIDSQNRIIEALSKRGEGISQSISK